MSPVGKFLTRDILGGIFSTGEVPGVNGNSPGVVFIGALGQDVIRMKHYSLYIHFLVTSNVNSAK